MYIIAIGWLYITVLMAATEKTVLAGVLSLFFYGLAPVALMLWIFGTPARRRARLAAERRQAESAEPVVGEVLSDKNRGHAQHDQ